MTSAHFIFIPSVLLVGIVIGWVLGARAARDAYAMELRKRESASGRTRGSGRSAVQRFMGSGFIVQRFGVCVPRRFESTRPMPLNRTREP